LELAVVLDVSAAGCTKAWADGTEVQGSGCRVHGSGCRVQGSGFRGNAYFHRTPVGSPCAVPREMKVTGLYHGPSMST